MAVAGETLVQDNNSNTQHNMEDNTNTNNITTPTADDGDIQHHVDHSGGGGDGDNGNNGDIITPSITVAPPTASATPAEVTKSSLRTKVWKHMNQNHFVPKQPWHNYTHSIPNFLNSGDAVTQLKNLEEFKNATHVMVNPDRSQYGVRMACLQENKNLYVLPPRFMDYIMTSYKPKEGATESDLEEALIVRNLTETKNRITVEMMDNVVPLDLIVIGSVAVSRDGRQLGVGKGYVDFYLAMLTQLKLLTPQTLIVTTVHDSQVIDSPPAELFGIHDFPIDIIVTPTEVIRTSRTIERPSGIMWNSISKQRLKRLPVVNYVREKEVEEGKDCVLKEEDSDHESEREGNHRPRRFFRGRRFDNRRRPAFNRANGTTNESDPYERPRENGGGQPRRNAYNRRYYNNYRSNSDTPSKRSFRDKAWQLLDVVKVCTSRRTFYDQIPGFKGIQDAHQKLRESELYKNATNVLVLGDHLHEQMRQFCLEDNKKTYILLQPYKRGIIRIDFPEGEEIPNLKTVNSKEGFEKYGVKIDFTDKFHVDLFIVGSAAVSKDGNRIGSGHGDLDIYYGLLTHMQAVDLETKFATAVHDCQVFETFPNDIAEEHDMPVDLIVTPTQVIEAKYTGPRTKGIYWDKLTERRLQFFVDVKALRDQLVEAGEECVLKKDPRKPKRFRRYSNKNISENETNEPVESDQQNGGQRLNGNRRFTKKRYSGNHHYIRGEGENLSPDSTTNRPKRTHKHKQYDFCIKVSNIAKNFHAKDLKHALEEKKVKPAFVKWNSYRGYSLLYFSKPNMQSESENVDAESILESLANLTLYPNVSNPESTNPESSSEPPLPNKLVVQMGRLRPPFRIETTDETAV